MVKYGIAFLIDFNNQFLVAAANAKMLCHVLPSNLMQQPIFSFSISL